MCRCHTRPELCIWACKWKLCCILHSTCAHCMHKISVWLSKQAGNYVISEGPLKRNPFTSWRKVNSEEIKKKLNDWLKLSSHRVHTVVKLFLLFIVIIIFFISSSSSNYYYIKLICKAKWNGCIFGEIWLIFWITI